MTLSKKTRPLAILLLLGLSLRLILSVFQYSGDIKNHYVWAEGFLSTPLSFYQSHFQGFNDPNYPPLSILLFSVSLLFRNLLLFISQFLNSTISIFPSAVVPFLQNENTLYAFLKLPGILADIVSAIIIYKLVSPPSRKLVYTALFLLNPAIIYISAVWGQIEPVTIMFLLLAFYYQTNKKKSLLSVAFFTLGVLTKQTVLWFGPFYLLLLYRNTSLSKMTSSIFLGAIIFLTSFLPFGLNPVRAVDFFFKTLSGSSTVVADGAWNLYSFILPPGTEDSLIVSFLSLRQISIIVLFLALGIILYKTAKNYTNSKIFAALFLWSLIVFFAQTRVHERHLVFALPFCLLLPKEVSRYLQLTIFITLTIFHLANLMSVQKIPFI